MPRNATPPQWIWSSQETDNQYVLFVKNVPGPQAGPLRVTITASQHYLLYWAGKFVARGPVHGDPQWVQYDEHTLEWPEGETRAQLAVVVHHARNTSIASIMPSRGGLLCQIEGDDLTLVSDETWKCLDLRMWRGDVPARGWALGYCEDYDARLEPSGWEEKHFPDIVTSPWPYAVPVPDAERIWAGYTARITPPLRRQNRAPEAFCAWRAPRAGAEGIGDVSAYQDEEPLTPVAGWQPFSLEALAGLQGEANAFTFDLGVERVGHYMIGLEAPAGVVIELSGAELLQPGEGDPGRPWVFRKGTRYSVRYTTRQGLQRFASFSWSGFRYLHVVVRENAGRVTIHQVGCLEKRAPLTPKVHYRTDDELLQRIHDISRHTLAICAQEHLIDCPTREQAQYWGDGVFVAESLWSGFGEPSYLQWYLECFLHVPINENGQINCIYPGTHTSLVDYSLIPLIGQRFYRAQRGQFYKAKETLAKALRLKTWYDALLDERGLVSFDYEAYAARGMRNFIDHPGIGWHNFPHPGIDRDGTSAPLNLFFYGYVRTLAEMASDLGRPERHALAKQADALAAAIRDAFYDGTVFHDARRGDDLSEATSWQTNSLAVYWDVLQGEDATRAMRAMLEGYDKLCRCSPYFHFYFLPALRKAGLGTEALELIKREWGPMVEAGATTTWESFGGDDKDSLCHPWSTAPFLYLLSGEVDRSGAAALPTPGRVATMPGSQASQQRQAPQERQPERARPERRPPDRDRRPADRGRGGGVRDRGRGAPSGGQRGGGHGKRGG